jgi:hypothetical protein
LEKWVFYDEVILDWGDLNPMIGFPIKRGLDTDIEEADIGKTEAEPGLMLPQAKECQEPPEAGRGMKVCSPWAFRGWSSPHLDMHTVGLQSCGTMCARSFKPLGLW